MALTKRVAAEEAIVQEIAVLNNDTCESLDYETANANTTAIVALCKILKQIEVRDRSHIAQKLSEIQALQPREEIAGGASLPYDEIISTINFLLC